MSWTVSTKGTTKEVIAELKAKSEALEGQSKVEYDGALPHLIGIVEQNFGKDQNGNEIEFPISVEAYGHGYAEGEEQRQRSLQVHITR